MSSMTDRATYYVLFLCLSPSFSDSVPACSMARFRIDRKNLLFEPLPAAAAISATIEFDTCRNSATATPEVPKMESALPKMGKLALSGFPARLENTNPGMRALGQDLTCLLGVFDKLCRRASVILSSRIHHVATDRGRRCGQRGGSERKWTYETEMLLVDG